MAQILVVTQQLDLHADHVVKVLTERGEPVARINTEEIPHGVGVRARLGTGQGWVDGFAIDASGRRVDLDHVRSVWWRRPGSYDLPRDLALRARLFAAQEWDETLRGLLGATDCYWMSHPDLLASAGHKPEQLARAEHLGLDVPRSLLTDDPDAVRAFFEDCGGRVVFKVLGDPFLGGRRVADLFREGPELESLEAVATPTTPLTGAHLDALDDGLALTPGLFQEQVLKRADLRVTVVGDTVFCAEMVPAKPAAQAPVWDGGIEGVVGAAFDLPDNLADRCRALVRSYGLNYSALDLLHTPDDRYVFLENNPNGQFLFVEELAPELRVTEAVADCLQRGGSA